MAIAVSLESVRCRKLLLASWTSDSGMFIFVVSVQLLLTMANCLTKVTVVASCFRVVWALAFDAIVFIFDVALR